LQTTGQAETLDEGKKQIEESIRNGSALKRFHRMIIGQGTNTSVADELCYGDKWKYLPQAQYITNITAKRSGYLENIDAMAVAKVCHALGCGRTQPGTAVKFEPGVILRRKPGDLVSEGETLLELHHQEISSGTLASLMSSLEDACIIVKKPPAAKSLIIETVV
jgi:thymidine phosphorylase